MLHRPAALLALLLLTSCEQAREAKNTYAVVTNAAAASEKMSKALEDTETRQAARAKKGDTLLLPYKELQHYLPDAVPGFASAEAPTGQTIKLPGMSYSQASREYHQGEQQLTVTLADYNSSPEMFTAAAAMTAMEMEMEDDDQRISSSDLGRSGLKAFERYGKKDRQASVTVAAGDRFLVTVSATEQADIEAVKTAAKSLKYDELLNR